ncbi:hypothetical protein D6D22_08508 [Aureobasidium pullulans]|uniref:Uncharacterized protein n=1 Tax=Aureobasidium pullulans TaxID=5580 RepID=A0A4S9IZS7_AURPU|nr:hypothetical protein D6D22_08508 [Aureobasidium pullulans]THX34710.1 hypothetical protein D6D12_00735 [Aureobasidium pullulans]THX49912.1 hypothetical protein D6D11_05512 [Aureobasidium pullulans]THX95331.1 hypothetical protein D6D08_01267 [Aureobasidium pullulans]
MSTSTAQQATTPTYCKGCRGTFPLPDFNKYLPADVEGAPTGRTMGTCKKCRKRAATANAAAAASKKKEKKEKKNKSKNKRETSEASDDVAAEPEVAEMSTAEVEEAADRIVALGLEAFALDDSS